MKLALLKLVSVGTFALITMVGAVQAAPITVLNPSFEAPTYSTEAWGDADGWIETGNAGAFTPGSGSFVVIPDGSQVGYAAGGSLQQTTSEVMVLGQAYKLTVEVGDRLNNNITDYTVALTGDGITLASDSNTLVPGNGEFLVSTVFYTALAADVGKVLGIVLSASAQQTNFDDVRLAAVPLPAAAWLFGSALMGLTVVARRRKTTQISA